MRRYIIDSPKIRSVILLLLVFIIGFVIVQLITIATPAERTGTNMLLLERAIKYQQANDTTTSLLLKEVEASELIDGWGQAILISNQGKEYVLSSFGADGIAGGLGKNADIIHSFGVCED